MSRHGDSLAAEAERLRVATTRNLAASLGVITVTSTAMRLGVGISVAVAALRHASGALEAAAVLLVLFLAAECFRPLSDLQNYWHEGFYGLAGPGTYRVFADFQPRGRDEPLTLGTDLIVPGNQESAKPLADSRVAEVSGYAAQLEGDLKQGELSRVTFTLSRHGRPVTDLEPYLGAYGHLITLRSGDLAYLHAHPAGPTAAGPAIAFDVEVPSTGTYRLFLDFQHQGTVRTAAFTLTARR